MTRQHFEHPAAGAELIAAAERLEVVEAGLGYALFAAVREALDAIDRYPNGWPPLTDVDSVVRSKSVKRFPFRVIYAMRDEDVIILAYAHERQRPGYWRDRYLTPGG